MINDERESQIILPDAPAAQAGRAVKVWSEAVSIDTYLPDAPDVYPAFFEKRVYQGSSGSVYPLPFHERIASQKSARMWDAVHIENSWIRIMILPELGGRIHIGYDKVADYDFFYRNNVIKPALVGLAGPWISGGVEFNWPQHHRPATFLPTDVEIEHEPTGAVTVWLSDHDPMKRMKGMHGIRVSPDSNVLEARVRLFNRTDERQTFLWWANVAAAVGDDYQSFFPEDVAYVADHARRALTAFPRADRPYYGIDYPVRALEARDHSDSIDWYRNIPVPTSYMVTDTNEDFFGGYDHGRQAGFVHVADRTVAPGKKQWTWGNSEFGWAWDRNLTDTDGPYVELMAGVFTDNQPDFSYIAPGETKVFSQYWYPIQGIGTANFANLDVALSLEVAEGVATVRLCATRELDNLVIAIDHQGSILHQVASRVTPGKVMTCQADLIDGVRREDLTVSVRSGDAVLARWQPPSGRLDEPRLAAVPPQPEDIASTDELNLTGEYLQQYRHATRDAEQYWRASLDQDAGDSRAHLALSALCAQRGLFPESEGHARAAVERLTRYVRTPRDGEAHYRLGIALERQGDDDGARDAFAASAWSDGWRRASTLAVARIDARAGRDDQAIASVRAVLRDDPSQGQAVALLAVLLRRSGGAEEASALVTAHLRVDPLDQWVRDLDGRSTTTDAPTLLDVALEYQRCGSISDALRVLDKARGAANTLALGQVQVAPLIEYHRAALLASQGRFDAATQALANARSAPLEYCLPSRVEDVEVLEHAVASGGDGRASLLLGDWYFHARRYADAMGQWVRSLETSTDQLELAMARRNLAIAEYNTAGRGDAASEHLRAARELRPQDARLLYESDQLAARRGVPSADRLAVLRESRELVLQRDDLCITSAELLIDEGSLEDARELLSTREFQPWEGGEGLALAQWDRVHVALAATARREGSASEAIGTVEAAFRPPTSLGEARHPLANTAELEWNLGASKALAGDAEGARAAWEAAAASTSDFADMAETPFGPQTVFSIRALRDLGRVEESRSLLAAFREYIAVTRATEATIDYFATSLPTMLLFHQDPSEARDGQMDHLEGLLDDDDLAVLASLAS